MAKRILDIVVASLGLLLALPVLIAAAIAVKLDSPGPVLYRAKRVGRDGVPFDMFKLRTMRCDADRMGPALTQGEDPRVTRCGRFLRNWKIDELPQLANVLRGEMSIVGPRPESPAYVKFYSPEQRRVLSVLPGITGPTQIRFRHEEGMLTSCTNLEQEYVERILPLKLSMDLDYIRHRSLAGDIGLMIQTAMAVAKPDQPASAMETVGRTAQSTQGITHGPA